MHSFATNSHHDRPSVDDVAMKAEPFHEIGCCEHSTDRRLLLLSYHFPPASSAGALRWQKLARFAVEHGWALDVVTLAPADVATPDVSRLADLPGGTRVFGVAEIPLMLDRLAEATWRQVKRIRSWPREASGADEPAAPPAKPAVGSLHRSELLRLRFRSPAEVARAFHSWRFHAQERSWALRAAALGMSIARPGLHHAVVTCGPPHMVHLAGRRIGARFRVPHIIDMRDPWSLVERLPAAAASPVALRLAERHERAAVRDASLVVANTAPACRALQKRYPEHASRIVVVMNGYDEDEIPAATASGRFSLAYAGTIYLDRNPAVLFRAAALLVREFGLAPAEFGIELKGHVESLDGVTVKEIAVSEGIGDFVRTHAPGSRREALELLASATVLISLPQDSDMAIPSKIFEYMQFPAWLLAFAAAESATGLALRGTDADVVAPDDVDATYAVLRRRFLQFRAGERPSPAEHGGPLSRRAQGRILFDEIERCLLSAPGKLNTARTGRTSAHASTTMLRT
jgi:glycosyltransferase involved in cell wall biosynthesis